MKPAARFGDIGVPFRLEGAQFAKDLSASFKESATSVELRTRRTRMAPGASSHPSSAPASARSFCLTSPTAAARQCASLTWSASTRWSLRIRGFARRGSAWLSCTLGVLGSRRHQRMLCDQIPFEGYSFSAARGRFQLGPLSH